jgi:mono/diheme cytochrome c family protein
MIKGLVLGIILGFLVIAGGTYFYFASGRAPVATSAPPMPFESTFARIGLHAYLDKLPHLDPAVPADEKNMLEGADVYKGNCAVCHGLPDQPSTAVAQGMFPKPPQLFRGTGVTDDDTWETYWKVENGIRMTGMPGFKGHLTETQIWQVSVLLKNADKLTPTVKAALIPPPPPEANPKTEKTEGMAKPKK